VPDLAGERYLRLLIEQILATGGRHSDGPVTVGNAGAALVAVGAVDADVVDWLRNDVSLALALRRSPPDAARLAAAVPRANRPLATPGAVAASPRAVAAGPNRFETPEGVLVVESVSFGPDGATVVEILDTGSRGPGSATAGAAGGPDAEMRRRRGTPWPAASGEPIRLGPQRRPRWRLEAAVEHRSGGPAPRTRPVGAGREQLVITDNRGHEYRRGAATVTGNQTRWRWVSPLGPVPPPATAWLDVTLAGTTHRLAVTGAGGIARGRPQARGAGASWLLGALQDAVARALRGGGAPRTDVIADGVDALLAVGALMPFEPLLGQLEVLAAYPDRAAELDASLGAALAGRDRRSGERTVTLPLATAVDLGDRAARFDVATLDGGGLRLSGWFSPWGAGPVEGTSGWHITGFDDRHNHYVSTVEQHHPGSGGADVVWRLWPALDSSARSLRLRVAGPSLEASVEVVVE